VLLLSPSFINCFFSGRQKALSFRLEKGKLLFVCSVAHCLFLSVDSAISSELIEIDVCCVAVKLMGWKLRGEI
jgi:hypothetical protein